MSVPRKYRVRGVEDNMKFEVELMADSVWHAIARSARRVTDPALVTSISVIAVSEASSTSS